MNIDRANLLPVRRVADIRQFAFVHDYKPYEDKPWFLTKLPIAVMVEMNAMPLVGENFRSMRSQILSDSEVEKRCGHNALHLIRQKHKESDDRQTEWHKEFYQVRKNIFLGRGYKMVGNDYWKLEVTMARLAGQDYLRSVSTIEETLSFLARLLQGVPREALKHHYFHRGAYTPIPVFIEEIANLAL